MAEEGIAPGAPYGIAEAGVVGDLNGVLSRWGIPGRLLGCTIAGDIARGEAVTGDRMYIGVPMRPLGSSRIVSMVVRREAVGVSIASAGEGKEDATEPDVRDE